MTIKRSVTNLRAARAGKPAAQRAGSGSLPATYKKTAAAAP